MSDKIYYCQNCGGIMEFDVKSQTLKCPNCDTTQTIENDRNKIVEHTFTRNAVKRLAVAEKQSSTMQCKGCGATVEVSKDCTATECIYCGTKYVLAEKQLEAIIPDGVLPFQIDKANAKDIFSKWIHKRWLAPAQLKNLYESDKIQGVYIPYWTFDAQANCDYDAEGGKRRTVREKKADGSETQKTVVDWYHTHGNIHQSFDDIQIKASKNMKASLLKGVEPYDTIHHLKSYAPEYLSGYSSECYTIPLQDAHKDAVSIMENELRSKARQDVLNHYDEARNVNIYPRYSEETYKHVLIPVYATSYSYSGKTYHVLVNGETGKIKGDYPLSKIKIAIIIVMIAVIGIAVFFGSKKGKSKSDDSVYNSIPSYTTEYVSETFGNTNTEDNIYDVEYKEVDTETEQY